VESVVDSRKPPADQNRQATRTVRISGLRLRPKGFLTPKDRVILTGWMAMGTVRLVRDCPDRVVFSSFFA
jgi:hypothetical protein